MATMNIRTRQSTHSHYHAFSPGGLTSVIVAVVFSALATVFVILRFWVRRLKGTTPLTEDWLIVAAIIFQWGYVAVVFLLAYDGGLGWPTLELSPDTLVNQAKYAIAGQTVWPICQGLVKVSICLTFIRIFFTRTFRIAATIVCCICVCWTVSTILVGYLICTPLYSQWNPTVTAKCGNESIAYVSLGVLDVLTELMVFALPMPMLYTLQVPKRTKVALIGTFCLCTFTVIAGIMRLVAVIQINFGTNFQQDIVADAYWCAIESSVGMTVANSLIMRPLLDRFLSLFGGLVRSTRALETSYRSNTGDYSTSGTSKGAKDGTFIRLEEQQSRPPRANAAVWKP